MRVLDLFSGLGGWALAGSWVWGRDHDIAATIMQAIKDTDFLK